MSLSEIERFTADFVSNDALRAEAEKAQPQATQAKPMDRLVAFAASKGYAFTVDEAKKHFLGKAASRELTDGELEGVSAGEDKVYGPGAGPGPGWYPVSGPRPQVPDKPEPLIDQILKPFRNAFGG